MPYIKQRDRDRLAAGAPAETDGELNYLITRICDDFVTREGMSYSVLNEVIGVLECAKQEFYRRVVVPYEERKREQNGDVYAG